VIIYQVLNIKTKRMSHQSNLPTPLTPVRFLINASNPLPPTPATTPASIAARERYSTRLPLPPFQEPASHSTNTDDDAGHLSELCDPVFQQNTGHRPLRSQIFSLTRRCSDLEASNENLGNKLRDTEKEFAEERGRMQDDQWRLAVRAKELESRLLKAAEDMMQGRRQLAQYEALIRGSGEFNASFPFSLEYDSPRKLTSVTLNDPPRNREQIANIVASTLRTSDDLAQMDYSPGGSPMTELEAFLI
jgi:hypothetical protein